jgi:hypothetical protein
MALLIISHETSDASAARRDVFSGSIGSAWLCGAIPPLRLARARLCPPLAESRSRLDAFRRRWLHDRTPEPFAPVQTPAPRRRLPSFAEDLLFQRLTATGRKAPVLAPARTLPAALAFGPITPAMERSGWLFFTARPLLRPIRAEATNFRVSTFRSGAADGSTGASL